VRREGEAAHRGLEGGVGEGLLGEVGGGLDGAHLVPDVAVALLVELDDVHDGLRVLLLLESGDAALLEELLPLLGEAGELAGGGVEADVGEVDGVVGGADLWTLRGVEKVGHEAEHALFFDEEGAAAGAAGGDIGGEGGEGVGGAGGKGGVRGVGGDGHGEASGGDGGGEEVVEGCGVGAGGAGRGGGHLGGCKGVVGWRGRLAGTRRGLLERGPCPEGRGLSRRLGEVCVSEEVRVLLDRLARRAMVLDRDFGLSLAGGGHGESWEPHSPNYTRTVTIHHVPWFRPLHPATQGGRPRSTRRSPARGRRPPPHPRRRRPACHRSRRRRRSGESLSQSPGPSSLAQQHGSVYWSDLAESALADLDPLSALADLAPHAFALPNAPIWQDSSTTQDCADLEAAVGGPQRLADLTGSRAYERFTGPQIARVRTRPSLLHALTFSRRSAGGHPRPTPARPASPSSRPSSHPSSSDASPPSRSPMPAA
jgi:hypothetical protein